MSKREIYRILDAAANRGREALRVVEDAARFIDDNEELTNALKATRHRFANAANKLDRRERLLARNTVGDIGTTIETEDEYQRSTLLEVLTANFARLQESARSLEEFSKLVEPQLAREWERIRYESYTLEKLAYEAAARHEDSVSDDVSDESGAAPSKVAEQTAEQVSVSRSEVPTSEQPRVPVPAERPQAEKPNESVPESIFNFGRSGSLSLREQRRERLNKSALCAYVDRPLSENDTVALFQARVPMFQLCFDPDNQEYSAETVELFLSKFLRAFSLEQSCARRPLLLSRGFEVWGETFDGGVAVGQNYREMRERLGEDYLIGAVVSDLETALHAFKAGQEGILDFVEAGPVFGSKYREPTGTGFLRAILDAVDGRPPIPVFAFGGVTSENCGAIFDSGIERIGVGAAILDAEDKRGAAMRIASLF